MRRTPSHLLASLAAIQFLFGATVYAAPPPVDGQAVRFQRDDGNGDGVQDRAEREAAARRDFEQTDVDHDGQLSIAEYQRWLEHHVRGSEGQRVPLPPAATASIARCYFKMVDRNGDGKLSLDEQQAHAARTFQALDRDADGRLTLAESKGIPDAKVMGPTPACH